jgi:hypothetical protein
MTELKYIVELLMGDPSGDGHDKHTTIHIRSNLSAEQIEIAFRKGTNKIQLDITQCCADYEDNSLTKKQFEILKQAGWDPENCWNYNYAKEHGQLDDDDSFSLSTDEFANIYVFTVQKGDSSFEYERLSFECIDIGGYGLFI